MNRSRFHRIALAVLAHALPLAALTGAGSVALYPLDVSAQARTVTTNRMLGDWATDAGTLRIEASSGQPYTLWILRPNEPQPTYYASLLATRDGLGLEGVVRHHRLGTEFGLARIGFDRSATRLIFTMDKPPTPELAELGGARKGVPAWLERDFGPWFGTWRTDQGVLTLEPSGGAIVGTMRYAPSERPTYESLLVVFAPTHDQDNKARLKGVWEASAPGARVQGHAELFLDTDRLGWTGYQTWGHSTEPQPWRGDRAQDTPPPTTPSTPATPTPPAPPAPVPVPDPTPAPPPAPAAFQPLNRVDVRLDRLVEARGYATRQVHAFVTLKNVSASPQYISSGFLRAVLTDADGVAQEKNQVWRASGEPAALFNSTPVVQPGGELKVRYVFAPDPGSTPASLRLSEGDKGVVFDATAM